jgi:type III secretion system regulator LcrR
VDTGFDGKGSYKANDRVTQKLRSLGYEVNDYKLSGTSLILGGSFCTKCSEIVYRVEQDDTVIIVVYRRTAPRQGLASPFADIIWFIELLTDESLGIRRVKAMIRQLFKDVKDGLSARRMKQFYIEYLGGRTLDWEDGDEWLYLDLKNYEPVRHIRKPKRR